MFERECDRMSVLLFLSLSLSLSFYLKFVVCPLSEKKIGESE